MLDLHDAADTDIVAPPAADKLRKSTSEWDDLLFDEAHHRIKNTLALLIAFLHQDFALIKATRHWRSDRSISRTASSPSAISMVFWRPDASSGRIYLGQHIERLTKALTVAILEPIGLSLRGLCRERISRFEALRAAGLDHHGACHKRGETCIPAVGRWLRARRSESTTTEAGAAPFRITASARWDRLAASAVVFSKAWPEVFELARPSNWGVVAPA